MVGFVIVCRAVVLLPRHLNCLVLLLKRLLHFFCVSVNVNTHRVGNPLVFAIYLVFVLHYRVVAVTKCGGEVGGRNEADFEEAKCWPLD